MIVAIAAFLAGASYNKGGAERGVCAVAYRKLETMLDEGRVFRVRDGSLGEHAAAEHDGWIYVDGELMDKAGDSARVDWSLYRRMLGSVLLHEAVHAVGYNHPRGRVEGEYVDYPFNKLGSVRYKHISR